MGHPAWDREAGTAFGKTGTACWLMKRFRIPESFPVRYKSAREWIAESLPFIWGKPAVNVVTDLVQLGPDPEYLVTTHAR